MTTPLSTYIAEQTAAEHALRLALPILVLDLEVTIDGASAVEHAADGNVVPVRGSMREIDFNAAQLRLDAVRAAEVCVGRAWPTDRHPAWVTEIIDGAREL